MGARKPLEPGVGSFWQVGSRAKGRSVQIQLLGGVAAVSDDGEPVDLGPAKCQAVLAALALSAGSAVPVSRIVELVWGSNPPRTAEKTLQSYVTRLRRTLGSRDVIVRVGGSYRLAVDPAAVDVHRFLLALDEGDVEAALRVWTGAPLAGLEAQGFESAVNGLTERWLSAVEANLAAEVTDDPARAVAELVGMTADHPFREELWALLMTGLYHLGRQGDALATYRQARAHLIEELGAEPGPRLQELERSILNHDLERRAAGDPEPTSPAQSTGRNGSPLPVPSTSLFGRDDEIASIASLLDRHRLITLTGLGGAGKTRLALAIADRVASVFPDGVFFASLAPVGRGDQIDRVVAEALGLTVGSTDRASIATFVGSRRLLLVLDNCEQVIDQVAGLVIDALTAGARGHVLATSREALDIDGELRMAVEPLDTATPDSPGVQLILDRGRHIRTDLAADDKTLQALTEICTRLDGIPLALELAAAQLAYLAPAELAARLDERFELLVRARPSRLSHHQTLLATMDWSWELLTDRERSLARQLAVFSGGWTLAAAEGLTADAAVQQSSAAMALDLRSLESKSLVVADRPERSLDHTRYRMLETVRLYAKDQLTETGEGDAAKERHARYFCDAANAVAFTDRYLDTQIGVSWAAEVDNIGAVLDWLRANDRLAEAAALVTMPATAWRFQPAPPVLRSAVDELLASELPPRARCQLLIARLDAALGWRGMASRRAQEIVELARELEDAELLSVGLLLAGSPLGAVDPDEAERLLTQSVEWGERAGDRRLVAVALAMLAGVHAFGRHRYDDARSLLDEATPHTTDTGFERQAVLSHRLTLETMAGNWAVGADAYRQLLHFHAVSGLPLSWSDAIDDAVFAGQRGEDRDRPLTAAVERLEAAGGDAVEWPDLLVVPLSAACAAEDWGRAARLVQAVRASARSGRPLSLPNPTAYYFDFRRRVPAADLEGLDAQPLAEVLADELTAEIS